MAAKTKTTGNTRAKSGGNPEAKDRATTRTRAKSDPVTRGKDREKARGSTRKTDHMPRITSNHRVIRRWVEERGGRPATVKGTRRKNDPAGLLRIDFPGYSGEQTLAEIPWNDFFAKFDEKHLAFLYQNRTADGQESRFCKFVTMETAAEQVAEGRAQAVNESGSDAADRDRATTGPALQREAGEGSAASRGRGADHATRATTNHRVIRRWVEERGGRPATVKGTRRKNDPAGLLRIDFPGYSGEQTLAEIPWNDFFAKFDEAGLVFLYQNRTRDGRESRFCKFTAMRPDE